MGWQKYTLCFRLLSPLHIGHRKVGNLMQTRSYVMGKNVWAALTARLTRDYGNEVDSKRYITIGEAVNEAFRFGYIYPALPGEVKKEVKSVDDLRIHYPWEDSLFDYRFLDSYASGALNYDQQAAAEGLLHEVEFIRPWARPLPDDDQTFPVYLAGDLYVENSLSKKLNDWRSVLCRIQFGAERGYGWGRVRLECSLEQGISEEPEVKLKENEPVRAHVQNQNVKITGPVEPLVGWERNNTQNSKTNWRLSSASICYTPGSVVKTGSTFVIGHYGIWE